MEVERESIFVSAIRSFARMFFAVCGLFLAFIVVSVVYGSLAPSPLIPEKTALVVTSDAEGVREVAPISAPAILQINVNGVIGDHRFIDSSMVNDILLDSRTGLLKNNRVKGILLRLNTPGGAATDADDIYRMLLAYKARYKVPIFAYVDGMCASGGMYIASAADQVYASPSSAIGSVGVILGPMFNVSDALTQWGIQARTLTQGIDKDMLNPTRPWKEGEDASLKAMMAALYERFVDIVAAARPRLDKEKLVNEYGAQIFDGVKAQELGYIDYANSNRSDALKGLLAAAQIDESRPYQVVELEMRKNLLSEFMSKSPLLSGQVVHSLDLGMPQIRDRFAYLYQEH